ncbi:MAG: hypothetical protein ACR2JD_03635, partial [Nocardioides sp.]
KILTRIVDTVVDGATSLVLSPMGRLGVGLAGLSVVLFVIAGYLRSRGVGGGHPVTPAAGDRGELPAARQSKSEPVLDDELDDIEAILRKRGIS